MNQIKILLIVLSLLTIGLTIMIFLPRIIIQFRAKRHSLMLSHKEAFAIQLKRVAKKDFFIGLREIWKIKKFPLEQIILHYYSSGNLINIAEGLETARRLNVPIDDSSLFTWDLANADLKTEIENSQKTYEIRIDKLRNRQWTIGFEGTFRLNFPEIIYYKNAIPEVEEKIKNKLETFLETWSNTNIAETEIFIRKNIIPNQLDGIKFIKQKYKITGTNNS